MRSITTHSSYSDKENGQNQTRKTRKRDHPPYPTTSKQTSTPKRQRPLLPFRYHSHHDSQTSFRPSARPRGNRHRGGANDRRRRPRLFHRQAQSRSPGGR